MLTHSPLFRRWFDRFWAFAGAFNIRTKILGMVLGLVFVLGIGITLLVRMALTQTMTSQLQEQSISVGRDLAARSTDLILLNDLYGLHRLLQETQANNTNVVYAFVLDEQGQLLVHTFGSGFPLPLIELNGATANEHHETVVLETNEGLVWDTAVPVLNGRAGTARVGLSDAGVRQAVRDVTGQLILTTILVSVIGVTAAVGLTWILTRPITDLVQAAHAVAGGDFSPRVRRWADDEIGDLADAFNQMAVGLSRMDELRNEREQLRRQLLEKVITTQEEERKRIARELHDSTSQALTSMMVGLRVMETACPDCKIGNQAQELREMAAQTLEEVHSLSTQLRPRLLDDLGLPAALERLVNEWRARFKIPVDMLVHLGDLRLPGTVETAIYRIIQETLTNIARHSGAMSVSILIERRGEGVVAVIEDDGVGFTVSDNIAGQEGPRLGILGMRERAELLGGQLTIESSPISGTSVFVEIPLKEPEQGDVEIEAAT